MSDESPDNPFFAWLVSPGKPLDARSFGPKGQASFIAFLRDLPQEIEQHILENRMPWMAQWAFDTSEALFFNVGDEKKLVEFLKVHFAQEIAALPA